MNTKELIEELANFETHCIVTDQLQVAELASNAHKALKQLQARCDELEQKLDIQTKRGDLASPAMDTACDFAEMYEQVKRERDELASHVENVKQMFITLNSCHLNSEWNENAGKSRSVIMRPPAQSLSEHDAEVARKAYADGYYDGFTDCRRYDFDSQSECEDMALHKADSKAPEYAQRTYGVKGGE
jgi:hypothetical protein